MPLTRKPHCSKSPGGPTEVLGRSQFVRKARYGLSLVLWTSGLHAQACLVLSPPSTTAEGTVLWDLSLYSTGEAPAGVQWTLQSAGITSLTVEDGPVLASAGKATFCSNTTASNTCLAAGANAKTIGNGVIAKLTAVLAPGATALGATMLIQNPLGVSATGYLIPVSAKITPADGTPSTSDCGLHPHSSSPAGGSK